MKALRLLTADNLVSHLCHGVVDWTLWSLQCQCNVWRGMLV